MSMDATEKVREARLRRQAQRQGLKLVRSRRRDPRAVGFGRYTLVDPDSYQAIAGEPGSAMTLDDVEARLSSPPRAHTAKEPADTPGSSDDEIYQRALHPERRHPSITLVACHWHPESTHPGHTAVEFRSGGSSATQVCLEPADLTALRAAIAGEPDCAFSQQRERAVSALGPGAARFMDLAKQHGYALAVADMEAVVPVAARVQDWLGGFSAAFSGEDLAAIGRVADLIQARLDEQSGVRL